MSNKRGNRIRKFVEIDTITQKSIFPKLRPYFDQIDLGNKADWIMMHEYGPYRLFSNFVVTNHLTEFEDFEQKKLELFLNGCSLYKVQSNAKIKLVCNAYDSVYHYLEYEESQGLIKNRYEELLKKEWQIQLTAEDFLSLKPKKYLSFGIDQDDSTKAYVSEMELSGKDRFIIVIERPIHVSILKINSIFDDIKEALGKPEAVLFGIIYNNNPLLDKIWIHMFSYYEK